RFPQLFPFPTRRSSDLISLSYPEWLRVGPDDATATARVLRGPVLTPARRVLFRAPPGQIRRAPTHCMQKPLLTKGRGFFVGHLSDRKSTRLNSSHVKIS